jgi:hypothetical protein
MAKTKTQTKKVKKTPTKYSRLLVVAAKELAAKKKTLVQAERALAKAKQKHEELIAEVARLDMVERSLKAMVEGTEPPTNVKYVYNYPQWVWCPYYQQPYVTYYWNGGNYQGGQLQGGTLTTNGNYNCSNAGNPYTLNNCQTSQTSGAVGTVTNTITSTSSGIGSAGYTLTSGDVSSLTSSSSGTTTFNNLSLSNSGSQNFSGLVVDLSTGAEQTDAPEAVETPATA